MAPNPKSAPANGVAAQGKAPSTNGTTTPAEKKDTSEHVGRPDKKEFDAEQDKIKSDIDALQVKLTAVRDKISLVTKSGSGNDRRSVLRAELDSIRGQQSTNKTSRAKIFDQVKTLNDGIQKKVKDLQAAKAKTPFKTVAEVEAHIKQLERQVESGSMKLAEEKRALAEITVQKRNRRNVEAFQTEQEAIDKDRATLDELRKQLDDPVAKAASERYDAIKAELDELKKEGDELYAGRAKLFEERDKLQAEINTLWDEKRESSARFRERNDHYWTKVNEDRARRAERARAQRAAEELAKKQERAERIREEAEHPAFQAEIEDCQTLIDFFSGKTTGAVVLKTAPPLVAKTDVAGVPKLELRKVEAATDGLVVRKKKGEEEQSYFVAKGKGKGKKAPAKEVETPASSSSALNIPLATLSALLSLSIPAPASNVDLPRVIEDLKTKKEWFAANQSRVTAENIAKAEKEIKSLAAKEASAEEDKANGDASPATPEVSSEQVADAVES
ncbi:unnamed protein product [Mycena citricolor]|uniref:Nuclear segregation protein Bfr1 n=1 Tax=Mycena citricolor TaxID=2018698 RepID=A0AAD2GT89_9AGAR|nr:unnamed protein product [Mycena citricolor]CAK5275649.1 unnamed protein product [Mycena citricolor]